MDVILKHVVEIYRCTNSLIILDDFAAGQDVKNRTSELVKLVFSAKTWPIHSHHHSTDHQYRQTSYNPNRNDMKTIIDDYLNGVDKTETNYIIKQLKDNKHARLEINLRHPYGYNVVAPHLK